jgi:hypothetical protein
VQGINPRSRPAPAAARVGDGSWRASGDAHDGQRPKQVHAVLCALALSATAGFIRRRAVTWAVLATPCIADLVRKASARAYASDRFPWDAGWPSFDRRADARAVAGASSVADLFEEHPPEPTHAIDRPGMQGVATEPSSLSVPVVPASVVLAVVPPQAEARRPAAANANGFIESAS